jgi:hypothetical protein
VGAVDLQRRCAIREAQRLCLRRRSAARRLMASRHHLRKRRAKLSGLKPSGMRGVMVRQRLVRRSAVFGFPERLARAGAEDHGVGSNDQPFKPRLPRKRLRDPARPVLRQAFCTDLPAMVLCDRIDVFPSDQHLRRGQSVMQYNVLS